MEVTINISDETVEWIEKAIKLKITPSRLRKIVEILWEEEIESLIDNDIFDGTRFFDELFDIEI